MPELFTGRTASITLFSSSFDKGQNDSLAGLPCSETRD